MKIFMVNKIVGLLLNGHPGSGPQLVQIAMWRLPGTYETEMALVVEVNYIETAVCRL